MTLETLYPALTGDGARRLIASDDRIVVVGAGGWLGLATLEALWETLGEAFSRRVVAYGSSERVLQLRGGRTVAQFALADLQALAPSPSLLLHLAFLTQEKAKTMGEADYVAANRAISGQVLAALDPIGATGIFVASSGAVYMAEDLGAESSKRLYGGLKLEDERAFAAWAEQPGRRAAIARIFNVAGPYMPTTGAYALAAFIADALAGRPISIRATEPVFRSYVAIDELVSVVFGVLTDGGAGSVTFDTAGDEVLEMDDIARVVAETMAPGRTVSRPALEGAVADRYVGDGGPYRELRHCFDVEAVDFPAQVRRTATFMALGVGSG